MLCSNLNGNEYYCNLDSFSTVTPGVNDVQSTIPSWFICEMEMPPASPSSSPSPSVTPSVSTSNSPTTSVSLTISHTPTPSPAYPVNAPIAHRITYVTGEWSVCSATCHGWSYRSVTCLIDGAINADASACAGAGLLSPPQLIPCSMGGVCGRDGPGHLLLSWNIDPWSPCSSPCMNGSDASAGISIRNVSCVDPFDVVLDGSACIDYGLPMPPKFDYLQSVSVPKYCVRMVSISVVKLPISYRMWRWEPKPYCHLS